MLISRIKAAESVAAGVLPPGDFQYPWAAICSINSPERSGCFDSESTFAAASKALIFCGALLAVGFRPVVVFPPAAGLEGAFFDEACFRSVAFFVAFFFAAIVFSLS